MTRSVNRDGKSDTTRHERMLGGTVNLFKVGCATLCGMR